MENKINFKLPYHIVFDERVMKISELDELLKKGQINLEKNINDRFVLKIGGENIAEGKIINQDNKYFFKIDNIFN